MSECYLDLVWCLSALSETSMYSVDSIINRSACVSYKGL